MSKNKQVEITERLRKRIRQEMLLKDTPKENLRRELKKDILFKFESEKEFNIAFEKAWRKYGKK